MRQLARRFRRNRRGASAIEFALIAPLILLLLAAVVDFGLLVHNRSTLETATSSAISYALAKGQDLKASNALTYAATIADIASRQLDADVTVDVILNRTLATSRTEAGLTQDGPSSAANLCYCPTRSAGTIDWGDSTRCNGPCSGGGFAGRFLTIRATKHYQPLFLEFGLISEGNIVVETLAGLQ